MMLNEIPYSDLAELTDAAYTKQVPKETSMVYQAISTTPHNVFKKIIIIMGIDILDL